MWAKTMVYSATSAADGRTELAIGDRSITVGVDYSTLDDDDLLDHYAALQSFSSDARSLSVIAETITSSCWILAPLLLLTALPWSITALDIPAAIPGILGQAVWSLSLVVSGVSFLGVVVFSTARSYYRYRVLSKLESEMSAARQEIRRRGLTPAE